MLKHSLETQSCHLLKYLGFEFSWKLRGRVIPQYSLMSWHVVKVTLTIEFVFTNIFRKTEPNIFVKEPWWFSHVKCHRIIEKDPEDDLSPTLPWPGTPSTGPGAQAPSSLALNHSRHGAGMIQENVFQYTYTCLCVSKY